MWVYLPSLLLFIRMERCYSNKSRSFRTPSNVLWDDQQSSNLSILDEFNFCWSHCMKRSGHLYGRHTYIHSWPKSPLRHSTRSIRSTQRVWSLSETMQVCIQKTRDRISWYDYQTRRSADGSWQGLCCMWLDNTVHTTWSMSLHRLCQFLLKVHKGLCIYFTSTPWPYKERCALAVA